NLHLRSRIPARSRYWKPCCSLPDDDLNTISKTAATLATSARLMTSFCESHITKQFHRKSICPPGNYDLRIGVMDHSTQKIGTLQAPPRQGKISAESFPESSLAIWRTPASGLLPSFAALSPWQTSR